MFKKKPQIKTLSPIRSSDRRKIADKIIAEYQLESQAQHNEDDAEAKAAATAAHTALRNSLLPDNALSAKFTTTHGPDLKEIVGQVYVGSHEGTDQRILWFGLDDRLYPTVYTLWKNPGVIPLLHTPSVVVGKLRNGADLMTPGLAGPPFPSRAKKGTVVAVASIEKPSVPLVVGVCEIDISALESTRGLKGQAVSTMHWEGDELWDWSTSGLAGTNAPDQLEGWVDVPFEELTEDTKQLSLEDDEAETGGVSLSEGGLGSEAQKENGGMHNLADSVEVVDEPDMTTEDIDYAFRQAFLYGVHHHMQANPDASKHGLTFPLSQSVTMSTLVLPFLPTFTPKQTEALVIKKTSWKNARKFIKSLDKEKLVLSKERPGNEVDILDVDFDDAKFRDFQPYRLPRKETASGGGGGVKGGGISASNSSSHDDSIGQKLKRVELCKPKDSLLPIFQSSETSMKNPSYYTPAEVRSRVNHYLESNNLVPPTNKRLANLDPTLANTLFNPNTSNIDAEVLAKGSVPREALTERILAACTPYHLILRNDEPLDRTFKSTKPKAGPAPKVLITFETRSGNKTVTRVSGLEAYHVSAQPLAEELRKSCASSTTVEPLKGAPPGKGFMEVMVQGPQGDAVVKALERRGVNKQWVEVLDKTKGKKR